MDISITGEQEEMTTVQGRVNRLLAATAAMVIMILLKRHYSMADSEQLFWILWPTARLTAWLTDVDPVWEAGVGFADFDRGIIIAPACAGVNFMIMAFGLAVFCGLGRLRRFSVLSAWIALSLLSAYMSTLGVNTLRIAVSMSLYRADIINTWLTPTTLHRLAGVCLYLGALGLFFKALQPIIKTIGDRLDPQYQSQRAIWPAWLPLGWYLLGAVGVPLVNLVSQPPLPAFGEHCLTVTAAAFTLWVVGNLLIFFTKQSISKFNNEKYGNNTDCRG